MGEFTDSEKIDYIDSMIRRSKGDHLERCESEYKNKSEEYMNSDTVMSGITHTEVLEGYRRERKLHNTVAGMIKEALHI